MAAWVSHPNVEERSWVAGLPPRFRCCPFGGSATAELEPRGVIASGEDEVAARCPVMSVDGAQALVSD